MGHWSQYIVYATNAIKTKQNNVTLITIILRWSLCFFVWNLTSCFVLFFSPNSFKRTLLIKQRRRLGQSYSYWPITTVEWQQSFPPQRHESCRSTCHKRCYFRPKYNPDCFVLLLQVYFCVLPPLNSPVTLIKNKNHTATGDSPVRHRGRRLLSQCHHYWPRSWRPCAWSRRCSHGFRTWRSSRLGSEGWGPPASLWSWPSGPPGPRRRWKPSRSRRSPAGKTEKRKFPKISCFPHFHVLAAQGSAPCLVQDVRQDDRLFENFCGFVLFYLFFLTIIFNMLHAAKSIIELWWDDAC